MMYELNLQKKECEMGKNDTNHAIRKHYEVKTKICKNKISTLLELKKRIIYETNQTIPRKEVNLVCDSQKNGK